jgi:hypothetical protein
MNPALNNRLVVLAADIKVAHQDVQRGAQAVAERALAAGRMPSTSEPAAHILQIFR